MESKVRARLAPADGGCMIWTGAVRNGYGLVHWQGRRLSAHRVIWAAEHGPIPEKMDVDHLCHNTRCVELSHLRLVTHAENMRNRAGARSGNPTGVRGVVWEGQTSRYRVRVGKNGKQHGKRYRTLAEAEAAAVLLRAELYADEVHIAAASGAGAASSVSSRASIADILAS